MSPPSGIGVSLLRVYDTVAPDAAATALVFAKVNGFDHESRPYGVGAIQKLGTEHE